MVLMSKDQQQSSPLMVMRDFFKGPVCDIHKELLAETGIKWTVKWTILVLAFANNKHLDLHKEWLC